MSAIAVVSVASAFDATSPLRPVIVLPLNFLMFVIA
jgi:hypothetical protein